MTAPFCIAMRCAASEIPLWSRALADLNDALQGETTFSAVEFDDASHADIICVSLLPDLESPTDWPNVEREWRVRAGELQAIQLTRGVPIFVATIFRHLPPEHAARMHRLRRLNLLAARLSQEFGLYVIDVDRVLAHHGALAVGSDAWLGSDTARDLAASVIVEMWLSVGIDHLVDGVALTRAIASHAEQRKAARERLSVPVELLRLERRQVKARAQVYGVQRDLIDDRNLPGLLRDLRAGRISKLTFMHKVTGKLASRVAERLRRH